jgi:archaeosine-15-forming tRNA-guanine transglycosylase
MWMNWASEKAEARKGTRKELRGVFKEMGKNIVELKESQREAFRKAARKVQQDPKIRAIIGADVLKLAAEGKAEFAEQQE